VKRYVNVLCAVVVFLCAFITVNTAHAGTATVYGKVTESDGTTPVASAEVRVWVRTGIYPDYDYVVDFPWIVKKVSTDKNGDYSISMPFPEIINIAFYSEVIKSDSSPFKGGYNAYDFYSEIPKDGERYNVNVKLFPYSNSVIIQGYVKDSQTGLSVYPGGVSFKWATGGRGGFYTDPTGVYRGIIRDLKYLGDSPYNITLIPRSRGVAYKDKSKILNTLKAGRVYTVNFNLQRDEEAGYILGRVIDKDSSNPIPYSSVSITYPYELENSGNVSCGFITDFTGFYRIPVEGEGTHIVSTSGAHTLCGSSDSYQWQEKEIEINKGEIKELDFKMISE